jgi:NAD-dependent dihydropyrimidine dehydrogenase PreA subunit
MPTDERDISIGEAGDVSIGDLHTVVVQQDICNGCGYCVPACPSASSTLVWRAKKSRSLANSSPPHVPSYA